MYLGSGDGRPLGFISSAGQGSAEDSRGVGQSYQHDSFLISTQKQPTKAPLSAKDHKKHRYAGEEQVGYFHTDAAKKIAKNKSVLGTASSMAAFKLQTLPWTPLVITDRHVLTATERSVQPKIYKENGSAQSLGEE